MAKPLTVFCDFDGTITERDMIISLCEKFCPPEWLAIKDEILSRKKTVRVGVAELFAMIPSSKKDAMIAYGKEIVRWRAGLPEFLDFCQQNAIPFIVCSGGLDFFVEPLLASFRDKVAKIYSIPADFSGPTVQVSHPFGCETEGLCKVKVMEKYPDSTSLLIGDSVTDVHGAHRADVVFARNGLQDYLDQDKVSYYPFETFHDVMKELQNFKGHPCRPNRSPAKPS